MSCFWSVTSLAAVSSLTSILAILAFNFLDNNHFIFFRGRIINILNSFFSNFFNIFIYIYTTLLIIRHTFARMVLNRPPPPQPHSLRPKVFCGVFMFVAYKLNSPMAIDCHPHFICTIPPKNDLKIAIFTKTNLIYLLLE